jgi:hypothetical protein
MPFRFSSPRIHEIVTAAKCPREGQRIDFEKHGEKGATLTMDVELKDGPLLSLKLYVSCYDVAHPESYRAALALDGERVRGVDYSPIARKKRYKEHIPKGWHENVIDPNLPTADDDRNRHLKLPDFSPTDLKDFLRSVAERWHIELEFEDKLL